MVFGYNFDQLKELIKGKKRRREALWDMLEEAVQTKTVSFKQYIELAQLIPGGRVARVR